MMPKGLVGIAHLSEEFEEALLPMFSQVKNSSKYKKILENVQKYYKIVQRVVMSS